jgi:hypothetical protein
MCPGRSCSHTSLNQRYVTVIETAVLLLHSAAQPPTALGFHTGPGNNSRRTTRGNPSSRIQFNSEAMATLTQTTTTRESAMRRMVGVDIFNFLRKKKFSLVAFSASIVALFLKEYRQIRATCFVVCGSECNNRSLHHVSICWFAVSRVFQG